MLLSPGLPLAEAALGADEDWNANALGDSLYGLPFDSGEGRW
jgi:hypothetical protein